MAVIAILLAKGDNGSVSGDTSIFSGDSSVYTLTHTHGRVTIHIGVTKLTYTHLFPPYKNIF